MLIENGYLVKAFARESSDVSSLRSLDVQIVCGDIRDFAAVQKAVGGCEQVYHLAAATSWRKPDKQEYYMVNVEGTANVARAALKVGVERLVYASTVGVYGTSPNSPVDESTRVEPDSFYRESKLAGEEKALAWCRKGLPVVIARLATVFGPGSLRWLGLSRAIWAKRLRFIGSGSNHVHDVYISDVVDGLSRCGELKQAAGKTYILAAQQPATVKQLIDTIAQQLEVDPPSRRLPATPFLVFRRLAAIGSRRLGFELPLSRRYNLFLENRVFSISKAERELGYEPHISMQDGIEKTIAWYRETGRLPFRAHLSR